MLATMFMSLMQVVEIHGLPAYKGRTLRADFEPGELVWDNVLMELSEPRSEANAKDLLDKMMQKISVE